jgi:peptidoglycan pentaglycine glycine transferase (the first glycine)
MSPSSAPGTGGASLPELDIAAWAAFTLPGAGLAAHPAHLLQTGPWGELKSRFGWQVARLRPASCPERGRGGSGAQVLFRPLGRWPPAPCIAYVPRGPIANWEDEAELHTFLAALHRLCRQRRAIFLKIEPDLPDAPRWADLLAGSGFRPSPLTIQPPRTIVVDLARAEEELLAAMKSKTRYNIRLAARKGVMVRGGTAADLPSFYRLMEGTGQRDAFAIHSADYYAAAYTLFAEAVGFFLAEHEGEPLAAIMVFAHGERAWYLYGASANRGRELMPSYLLQWEAMRWARQRGCRCYDLWGIPDEDEEVLEADFARRSDGLWGVYRFKRGFGGRVVRSVGAWDYVYSPPLYWLATKALAWRKISQSP